MIEYVSIIMDILYEELYVSDGEARKVKSSVCSSSRRVRSWKEMVKS